MSGRRAPSLQLTIDEWRVSRRLGGRETGAFSELSLFIDAVDNAELTRFFRRHEVIAVERLFHALIGLARMLHVDFVQTPLGSDDVFGVAFDVRGLAAEAA